MWMLENDSDLTQTTADSPNSLQIWHQQNDWLADSAADSGWFNQKTEHPEMEEGKRKRDKEIELDVNTWYE